MKTIITISLCLLLFLAVSTMSVRAQETYNQAPMYQMMQRMMGTTTLNSMEQIEQQMMGSQNYQRMEDLMSKMLAGTLSSADQQEMVNIMQGGSSTGTGATMLMMQNLMSRMFQNNPWFGGVWGWNGMANFFPFAMWVTAVLVWVILVLVIIALWRWIMKKSK